jgi:hypothetical protein
MIYNRTKNYQKKITHIGTRAFQQVCAVRIQRLWRGRRARAGFRRLLREYYRAYGTAASSGGGAPSAAAAAAAAPGAVLEPGAAGVRLVPLDDAQLARRKRYYETEFSSITRKLSENVEHRGQQVSSLFRSVTDHLINLLAGSVFKYVHSLLL